MSNRKVTAVFEIQVQGKNVKVVAKDTEKLGKNTKKTARETDKLKNSTDNLRRSRDKYNRTEKGVAGLSSNSTKNFSKMQQSIDGGGSGGLVRAYALLAANVFALSAAFGILSRSAQIDTLVESIVQLEVVGGRAIRSTARELQQAARFGLSFSESLRSVSLATSAGFGADKIKELGDVATNAAISLGRNLPDALDRIFRGVIKVEPELLDEIGLFVRVNEAASKYAADLGIAVGDLTEFQRRQAFLNEAIDQGQKKFSAFEDIETDPFAKLATTFADITQNLLSLANTAIKPVVNLLAENKVIFTTVFVALAASLIRLAVPAFGAFTQSIAANAAATQEAAEKAKRSANERGQQNAKLHREFLTQEKEKLQAQAARIRAQNQAPVKLRVRGRDASANLEAALVKQEVQGSARLLIIKQRLADIDSTRGRKARENNAQVQKEKDLLLQEKAILEQIALKENEIRTTRGLGVAKESLAQVQLNKARLESIRAESVANIVNTAQTQGLAAAFKSINFELTLASQKAQELGVKFGIFSKAVVVTKGIIGGLAVGIQSLFERFGGLLSIGLLLLPLIQGLAKAIGFGSKEAQALADATKLADEQFGILERRIERVNKVLAENAAGSSLANKAQEAFVKGLGTTTDALQKQIDAYEDAVSARPIITFISELNPFSENTITSVNKNAKRLIKTVRENGNKFSEEVQKTAKSLEVFAELGILNTEQIVPLLGALKEQEEALTNVRSAIDGAADAARKFTTSLIVKTDVDAPLATFRQLETTLNNQNISLQDRIEYLEEISNNQAIISLLTQDQRNELKKAVEEGEGNLDIITAIKEEYFAQQEILIRQKEEITKIGILQKQLSKTTKLSLTAVQAEVDLLFKKKNLEREILEGELQRQLTATGLTRATLEELSQRETLLGIEKEFGLEKENIVQVQAGLNALQKLENFNLEENFRLATEALEVTKGQLEAQQNLLNEQIKLNNEKTKSVELESKLEAFARRGSTSLTQGEELSIILQEEKLRQETLDERKRIAEDLARIEFDIVIAQLNALQIREELLTKEGRLLKEQEIFALKRSLGIDNLSPDNLKKALEKLKEIRPDDVLKLESLEKSIAKPVASTIAEDIKVIETASEKAVDAVGVAFDNESKDFALKLVNNFEKSFKGSDAGAKLFEGLRNSLSAGDQIEELLQLTDKDGNKLFTQEMLQLKLFEETLLKFANSLESMFGDQGAFPAALGRASANMISITTNLGDTLTKTQDNAAETTAAIATAIAGSLQSLSSVFTAYSQQAISEIDGQIEAEKRRDGKSQESMRKIEALEKRKDTLARKQFETNKKIQLASAVASTAAGVAGALSLVGTIGPVAAGILAGLIGAMGVAQIAIISKLKYGGGVGATEAAKPTNLQIGQRSNAIDVSQGATAGELSYLRGTTATASGGAGASFPGAAMGRRSYADGGVVVGERGPEVIAPSTPVDIIPNYALEGQSTNVNFTINALDASGVEDVLMGQQGNIIRMIRQAANENGENFLPNVDTMAYGSKT